MTNLPTNLENLHVFHARKNKEDVDSRVVRYSKANRLDIVLEKQRKCFGRLHILLSSLGFGIFFREIQATARVEFLQR